MAQRYKVMLTPAQAAQYIHSHGHTTHYDCYPFERIVAESELVANGKVCVEYETFFPPFELGTIRDWLGY